MNAILMNGKKWAYFFAEVLVGHNDDIGGISHCSGGSSDIGEDYLSNQDMPGVQIQHLT